MDLINSRGNAFFSEGKKKRERERDEIHLPQMSVTDASREINFAGLRARGRTKSGAAGADFWGAKGRRGTSSFFYRGRGITREITRRVIGAVEWKFDLPALALRRWSIFYRNCHTRERGVGF